MMQLGARMQPISPLGYLMAGDEASNWGDEPMRKTAGSERRGPDPSADIDAMRLFPFMPNSSWYQEYWYEQEPSLIRKVFGWLFRLPAKAALDRRMKAEVSGSQSEPNRSDASVALR
jgi:hypothetical protein